MYLGLDEALLLHEGGALGPLLLALAHTAAQHLDLLDHLQQGARTSISHWANDVHQNKQTDASFQGDILTCATFCLPPSSLL